MSTFFGARTRAWTWWVKAPKTLFYANGGVGDELFITAIARAARAGGHPIDVLTPLPELWRDNPDPASLQTGVDRWFYARRRGWISTDIRHLAYENGQHRHIAEQMAGAAGVTLSPQWRPILNFLRPARRHAVIALQNSCRGARYQATTKEWPQSHWNELTHRLAKKYELWQLGTLADPPLTAAQDFRGKTDLHEAAARIASASCFLGLESGLMHVAAAAETPAVIIYGGRSRPIETGYAFNTNLTRNPPCAGCGLNDGCPNGMVCMEISVEEVERAVDACMTAS